VSRDGDEAAEDLFVLVAETGAENARVVIAPVDFRVARIPSGAAPARPWVGELYRALERELRRLPSPGKVAAALAAGSRARPQGNNALREEVRA